MFRKSDNARREWSPELVHSCAARQAAILEQAAKMVVPGGTIVYSTCTFAPEENEGVIAGFLQEHPEFEVAPPNPQPGFSSGRPDWAGKISSKIADQIENTVRLWPHQAPGDGHFIARLNHNGSPSGISHHPRAAGKLPLGYRQAFNEFFSAALEYDLGIARLLVKGAYLYHIPEQLPDLSGLHVIHTGLWLGVFKGGTNSPTIRFEPAHALALAIKSEQARHVSELNFKQAVSYLRGEVLSYPGEDGWVLATFDRFPLGWGKRSKGRLNNYYPKGLRWV
jgi:NOL1/NOP2/fmu family ribosome biogenesis protein